MFEYPDDAIAALGRALANLVNLTNPERIVVGGWVGIRRMDALADRIGAAILPLEQLIRESRG